MSKVIVDLDTAKGIKKFLKETQNKRWIHLSKPNLGVYRFLDEDETTLTKEQYEQYELEHDEWLKERDILSELNRLIENLDKSIAETERRDYLSKIKTVGQEREFTFDVQYICTFTPFNTPLDKDEQYYNYKLKVKAKSVKQAQEQAELLANEYLKNQDWFDYQLCDSEEVEPGVQLNYVDLVKIEGFKEQENNE